MYRITQWHNINHIKIFHKGRGNEFKNKLIDETLESFPYTRDLQDWSKFIRRISDEYEAWVDEVNKECAFKFYLA